jgi:hypothetical protein
MKTLLGLLIIMTACGQDPNLSDASKLINNDPNAASQTSEASQNSPDSANTEASELQSLYLDKKEDLWPCVEAINRQLVYIAEEEMFYTCQSKKWVEVAIKGEKGDKGDKGDQGEEGDQGKDGHDGVDGKNGKDGKDGAAGAKGASGVSVVVQQDTDTSSSSRQLMANEWIDPISGVRWFTGSSFQRSQVPSLSSLCPQGSKSPTDAELAEGGLAGLFDRFATDTSFAWIGRTELNAGRLVQLTTSYGNQGMLSIAGTSVQASPSYYKTLCIALD